MSRRMEPQIQTNLLFQQARRHQLEGSLSQAVTLYGQILSRHPRNVLAIVHLAEIAFQFEKLDQAASLLEQAVRIAPHNYDAHDLLWQVRKAAGDLFAAARTLRRVLELRQYDGRLYYELAKILLQQGEMAEAGRNFEWAIRYKPDDARVLADYASFLHLQGRLDYAVSVYRDALLHSPRDAGIHCKLGELLGSLGQFQEALVHIEKAILLDPTVEDFQVKRWRMLLKSGRLQEGFAVAERRLRMQDYQPRCQFLPDVPLWKGETFEGSLLVIAEKNPADVLQYARYLVHVKTRVERLVVALPKSLLRLFSNLKCIDDLVEAEEGEVPTVNADRQIAIGSLPLVFGTALHSIPSHTPFLFPDPFLTHSWIKRLKWHTLKIGIMVPDLPAASIEPLLNLKDISWYDLQLQSGQREDPERPILDDYADCAAIAANLDLILAQDSPQAHLAAAIGKPVWTLLPFEADWRWFHLRQDSPWYPTMRLFRQTRPGDWNSAIDQVIDELGPKTRPFRHFQLLQGNSRDFRADHAVVYAPRNL